MHRLLSLFFTVVGVCIAQHSRAADVDYQRDIKPLLRARCYACHGALKQQAGLRLDTAESIRRGGDSGPAIGKDDPTKSVLLARVSAQDPAERMPPEQEGEPLTEAQIALLRSWISSGAHGPANEAPESDPRDHWSFRPIERPPLPKNADTWAKNPIDRFVQQQYEQRGLKPVNEASRWLLLRRLSFDLIGLPPSPQEIIACEQDNAADWYERTVDRLLDDPRYGERWGRHWMDVWRYSDWWGLGDQLRNSQKHIWHWRDWIIESLNADLPYDEMIRLMLAADELAPNDLDKLRATGFLARNYFLFNRNQWMDETVEHVSKAFLGLTMNCAKCHDHKYDPITQTDYYQMRAFFEPYHVRLDLRPGESDLVRDGIPVAFDGLPDLPTYRFIRGNENNPDKTSPIPPGVPKLLEFEPLTIASVDLPSEAWQPERRAWVIESYRHAAHAKLESANAKLAVARERMVAAEHAEGAEAVDQSLRALHLAELAVGVAKSEWHSVELRAAAMQASWKRMDAATSTGEPTSSSSESEANRAAARAEREVLAAQARLALADAESRLNETPPEKRDPVAKQVAAAREALDKALKQLVEPSEQFTKFAGAQWTPTRFFNSSKDDPTVPFPPRSTGRRKALAEWITSSRNPLTARVAVNHLWLRHFGTPLVPSLIDFGRKGNPPANQQLLDWLAAELIESGWSMKHLHRLIVCSATYRLAYASTGVDANLAADFDNIYMWRRTPVRLESEAVRDGILRLAGDLDSSLGGPSVPIANQADSNRRSLYFLHSNNERNLFLTVFDEAAVTECYRREQSIVPQQALALANSRLVLDASPRIAEQLEREFAIADDATFVRRAFIVLLGYEPQGAELAAVTNSLEQWKKLPESTSLSVRANLIWVLLNHNDFVTLQ